MRGMLMMVCGLAAVAVLLGGCARNAATGRMQFNQLSTQQEIALGQQSAREVLQQERRLGDEVVQGYVSRVGMELTRHVEGEYRDLPWSFVVIDSDQVNAFALPGGPIFLYRGLLERMTNEDQLAAVLAHEIGHVVGEHADDRISRAMIAQGLVTAAGIGAGVATENESLIPLIVGAGGAGSSLYILSYSREQEAEADALGMRYMTRGGWNPEGMLQLMEIVRDASEGGRPPEYLSTHPHPETRIRVIVEGLRGPYREVATRAMTVEPFERNVLSRLGG